MAGGFIHSQVLLSCVRLELFERLRNGPLSVDAIAASASVGADSLEPLLRAAAALRLLERRPDGRYGLGVLGASMVDNPALESLIDHHEYLYRDLADPVGLFTGASHASHMQALWPYATAAEPGTVSGDGVERYTALMASSQAMVADQVLGAVDLKGQRRLMDLGGGSGAFAKAVHARWPSLEITIVDLPIVAKLADVAVAEAGIGDAVRVVGADATRDRLPDGFDVVSLIRILHDHDDDVVRKFLEAAHRALRPDGVLLIGEPLADAPGAGRLIDAYFNVYLHAMGSGRPRRYSELQAFLREAGFRAIRRRGTRVPLISGVITARRST